MTRKEIREENGTTVITEKDAPAGMGADWMFLSQADWETQNEIEDETYAEACSEAEQAEQDARCAEYEAAEEEQARYEAQQDDNARQQAEYEEQSEEEYYP
jgi:hypothetical protein